MCLSPQRKNRPPGMIPLTPRKFSGDKIEKQLNGIFLQSANLIRRSNSDDLTYGSLLLTVTAKLDPRPLYSTLHPNPKVFLTVHKGDPTRAEKHVDSWLSDQMPCRDPPFPPFLLR